MAMVLILVSFLTKRLYLYVLYRLARMPNTKQGTVVLFEWFTIVRDFLDESVPQSANLMPEEEPKEQDVCFHELSS